MAQHTAQITNPVVYPEGQSVSIYPKSNWPTGGNAAVASLLAQLAAEGFIIDNTTA